MNFLDDELELSSKNLWLPYLEQLSEQTQTLIRRARVLYTVEQLTSLLQLRLDLLRVLKALQEMGPDSGD